jgi:hypothetical protein
MQLVELFLELLIALSESVAQSTEIAQLMELDEKLAEITEIKRRTVV